MGITWSQTLSSWLVGSILATALTLMEKWLWLFVLAVLFLTCWAVARLLWHTPSGSSVQSQGKAVLITGCDSGFGFDLCQRLDGLGFVVFAGVLLPDGPGASALKSACSDSVLVFGMDVTSDSQVESAVTVVKSTLKQKPGLRLWAIVNNAGIMGFAESEWCPLSTYKSVMEVNAFGAVRVTQAFLSMLRESQGRVVNVASNAGRFTFPYLTAYSMSKQACISFSDGLRREMHKFGVKVIVIEPGSFKTAISAPDNVRGLCRTSWQQAQLSTRQAYGGDQYINRLCSVIDEGASKGSSPLLRLVVDCLADAVTSSTPHKRYLPIAMQSLVCDVLSLLPAAVADFLIQRQLTRLNIGKQ